MAASSSLALTRAGAPVDAAQQAAGLVHQRDVFGDRQIGKDGGLLVNGGDAQLPRTVRAVVFDGVRRRA